MAKDQRQALEDLRKAGYAVVIWTPLELASVKPELVEHVMIKAAYAYLDILGVPMPDMQTVG